MKLAVLVLLLFVGGCAGIAENQVEQGSAAVAIQELMLTDDEIVQLGMTRNDCQTEEYQASEYSPVTQYSICFYTIIRDDTEVIIELTEFSNPEDLNGTYQYASQHLRSIHGLLSEKDYGDQSRFYINHEDDYGAEFNDPDVHFYSLYICKDLSLIHITSRGTEQAGEDVAAIGRLLMTKFS